MDHEEFPGERLDAFVSQLRAKVGHEWRVVVMTDDVHHLRIEDTFPPSVQRDALQKWLRRRESYIYSSADSVLAITEQDRQTITSLLGTGEYSAHMLRAIRS